MSVLTHRCRFCGHLEDRHAARERGYQPCPCCNGARSSVDPDLDPEPELHPTYALPGQPSRAALGTRSDPQRRHEAMNEPAVVLVRLAQPILGPLGGGVEGPLLHGQFGQVALGGRRDRCLTERQGKPG